MNKKTEVILLKVTPEEKASMKKTAQALSLSLSAFLRMLYANYDGKEGAENEQ